MSEAKFDRLEKMMEQVIRVIGNVAADLEDVKANMATKDDLAEVRQEVKQEIAGVKQELKQEIAEIKSTLVRLENDHGAKLSALADGFLLRGDQISQLRDHIDERFDVVQTDLSYVVSKIAQHERDIVQVKKQTKAI